MKKVVVIAMVLGLVSIASAADSNWNGGAGDWNNGSSWDAGVPDITVGGIIDVAGSNVTLSGTAGSAFRVFVGEDTGTNTLNVSTGLTADKYIIIGHQATGTGILNVYAGANIVTDGLCVGDSGNGTLNMYGGTLTVTGGEGFQAGIASAFTNAGTGHVQLNGGTLDVTGTPGLRMGTISGASASLDIAGGALILPGSVTDLASAIIATAAGSTVTITAYGGSGGFVYTPDGQGNTIVTAIPEPATIVLFGLGALALIRQKRS
jgi:hypothetical protein